MSVPKTHRRPALIALAASAGLTALIIVGSRNLEHYDPALFGYTVASVVAFGAVVFRYAVWLGRPATRIYWRRGWQLFRDRKRIAANTKSAAQTFAQNLIEQRFIARRGFTRWLMHALIMWGCVISALVTFPLVFGWIHFKLEGADGYRAYLFGFPTSVLPGRSLLAWITFHALDFTAIMVIIGCAIAIRRRRPGPQAGAREPSRLSFKRSTWSPHGAWPGRIRAGAANNACDDQRRAAMDSGCDRRGRPCAQLSRAAAPGHSVGRLLAHLAFYNPLVETRVAALHKHRLYAREAMKRKIR